jgi:hypothetical protein
MVHDYGPEGAIIGLIAPSAVSRSHPVMILDWLQSR